jgi:hypothetical protein
MAADLLERAVPAETSRVGAVVQRVFISAISRF